MKFTVAQLKQRKIFQWGVAYLAGAWVLLQLTDLLANQFGWPGALTRSVTVLLGLGFFAVLIIAWYHGERGQQRVTAMELIMLTALVVTAGATIALVVRKPEANPGNASDARTTRERGSIAVLPFVNMSDDKQNEYFSDGVTEEILNVLAQVTGLRVAARTSSFAFKGQNVPIARIGDSLNVAAVLEGSVRKAGNQVRITAQLINTNDGYHMWSEAYDRELKDVFKVQEEIARAIVDALKVELSDDAAPQVRGATSNPRAHDLYLQGLHHWNRRTGPDLLRAAELFTQALEVDPNYARAHAGLAGTYVVLPFYTRIPATDAVPKTLAAIKQTFALDSTIAEAHAVMGDVMLHYYRDPVRGAPFLRRALELNPQDANTHIWYAEILKVLNQKEEVEREQAKALELDPLSARAMWNRGDGLEYRDPQRAEALYRRAIELQPSLAPSHRSLGLLLLRQKRWQEAATELSYEENAALIERIVAGIRDAGRKTDALKALDELVQGAPRPAPFAAFAMLLGDRERALQILERADRMNDPLLIFTGSIPELAPLRGDARYVNVLKPVRRF